MNKIKKIMIDFIFIYKKELFNIKIKLYYQTIEKIIIQNKYHYTY